MTAVVVRKKQEHSLLTSRRIQSRKEVVKITIVPQFQHVLVLCGGRVSVHDMHSLETIKNSTDNIAAAVKMAQGFAIDRKSQTLSRLCIASKKKKIILFDFSRGEYTFWKDIALQNVPITMKWHGDSIYLGDKSTYKFINVNSDTQVEVPIPIKDVSPIIQILPQGHILLASNEIGVLVDENGNPVAGVVDWTGKDVVDAGSCYPYFITLSKSLSSKSGKNKDFGLNVHYNGMEHQLLQEIAIDGKNPMIVTEDGMRIMMDPSRKNASREDMAKVGSRSVPSFSFNNSPVLVVTSSPNQILRLEATGYLKQVAWLLYNDKVRSAEKLLQDTLEHTGINVDNESVMSDFYASAAVIMFVKLQFNNNGATILEYVKKAGLDPRELLGLFLIYTHHPCLKVVTSRSIARRSCC